jgi:signal transduction histidine kinase
MNRLASLGSLVAGLAHEIRNPLGSLKGLAQLLGEDLPENDKKRQYTGIIVQEIDRLNRVVEELLSFAQPTTAEFEPLDINDIVRDALILAQTNFRERTRMVQAILNILTNAFVATPDEGLILIETRLGQDGNLETPVEMPQAPRSVIIDFFNSGPSLSFEESRRMFDPFFTTKEKGTGLGLAIAQQVTTAHGGSLTVISQFETGGHEGITFRMELPVKGSAARILNGSPGPS